MKQILFLLFLLPVLASAQTKPKAVKQKATIKTATEEVKPVDGFIIKGDVKGYADGATVALLNGQTGAQELQTTIQKNKFVFKGKMEAPDFRILLFENKQPYVTLFLDNSSVKVTGAKETIQDAIVTGSSSHKEYDEFNKAIAPYQKVFSEDAPYDSAAEERAAAISEDFTRKHPNSFVAALSLIRFSQVSEDYVKTEQLFSALSPAVRTSGMGNYVAQLIGEARRNAIGTVLADFTQNDTTGAPLSLSSLRGKYVLIDFWASWCRPCRQENPNVVAAFNKYRNKNFTVLGVSLDKAKPAWIDAINMDGLTWPHVSDLQGWQNSVAQQFGIGSIPQNFLIGPDGKIIGKNLRGAKLERKLSRLLQ